MMGAQFLRFLSVGLVNTAIGYGTILILQLHLGVGHLSANAIGYAVGMAVSYALNRSFTFRSRREHAFALPLFAFACLSCYLINLAVLQMTFVVLAWPAALAQAAAVATYAVAFYLLGRHLVFRP